MLQFIDHKAMFRPSVAAGMDALNEHFNSQEWRSNVNKVTLNMLFNHKCTLGQLFGDYFDGMRTVFSEVEFDPFDFDNEMISIGMQYGFTSDIVYRSYRRNEGYVVGPNERFDLVVPQNERFALLGELWKEALTPA